MASMAGRVIESRTARASRISDCSSLPSCSDDMPKARRAASTRLERRARARACSSSIGGDLSLCLNSTIVAWAPELRCSKYTGASPLVSMSQWHSRRAAGICTMMVLSVQPCAMMVSLRSPTVSRFSGATPRETPVCSERISRARTASRPKISISTGCSRRRSGS